MSHARTDRPLDGKLALVTGGGRGIGRAIVQRLARDGARVVFSYLSGGQAASRLCSSIAGEGGDAHAVQADQGVVVEVRRLFDEAERLAGRLDVLVLNAGAGAVATLAELDEHEVERVIAVNVTGSVFALQEAARRMRDGGRIVCISTVNTVLRGPGLSIYAATKAAVEQLAVVAALELAPRGITVNVVSPGATDTEMFHAGNPEVTDEMIGAATPLGRIGDPSDVAEVVAFFAGPDSRWLTGQHLRAAGGLDLNPGG